MAILDASLRNLGVDFSDLMGLPLEQRRVQLLGRCQDVYNLAIERRGMSKGGEYGNPDCSAANKVIETVAKLVGLAEATAVPGASKEDDYVRPSVAAISGAAAELERARKGKAA